MISFFAFMNPTFRAVWLSLWGREVGWGVQSVLLVTAEVLLRRYPVLLEWSERLVSIYLSFSDRSLKAWKFGSLVSLTVLLGVLIVPLAAVSDWRHLHFALALTAGLGFTLWLLMSGVDSLEEQASGSPFLGAVIMLGGLLGLGLLAIKLTNG